MRRECRREGSVQAGPPDLWHCPCRAPPGILAGHIKPSRPKGSDMTRTLLSLALATTLAAGAALAINSANAADAAATPKLGTFGVDLSCTRHLGQAGRRFQPLRQRPLAGHVCAEGRRDQFRFLPPAARRFRSANPADLRRHRQAHRPQAGQQRAEGARLLQQLHEPRRAQCRRHRPAEAGAGQDRRDRLDAGAGRRIRRFRRRRHQCADRRRRRAWIARTPTAT